VLTGVYDYLRRMTKAWTSAATGEKPCVGGPEALLH
jgi:hypothetical protein